MITLQQFAAAIQCTLMTAEAWHAPFEAAMIERDITTPRRIAAFLAQVGHESASLSVIEENLNYSAQRLTQVWPRRFPSIDEAHYYEHAPERLANLIYSDRMGNGNYDSGDGWRFRGRGPVQITGRSNYSMAAAALGLPLLDDPDLLLQPNAGAASAAWYWHMARCNELADADEFAQITHAINGGNEGADQRIARYEKALEVLSC